MLSLRDRLYYKVLPFLLRVAECWEYAEYERQKARIERIPLPLGEAGFISDPPANLRNPVRDMGRISPSPNPLPKGEGFSAYLFLTHGRGGGVDKYVEDTAAALEAEGKQACILHFHPLKRRFFLSRGKVRSENTVNFRFPSQYAEMITHLRALSIGTLSIQHTRYLPYYFLKDLPEFANFLDVPYDYMMHDFIAFCPRIHLIDGNFSYCGMPQDANECDACIRKNGILTIAPANALAWRETYRALLAGASVISAPSHDTAHRHQYILGDMKMVVIPHDSPAPVSRKFPAKPEGETFTVAVIGRIHRHKGSNVLLACARDAQQRRLPLQFKVIGDSAYARQLRAAGITLTGEYKEGELPELLRKSGASLVFLPSVWPETYSYVLSHIWQNGYFPVAFDLGAPAERIKAVNNGLVLPVSMIKSPVMVNDFLLKAARQQHEPSQT